MLTKMWQLPLAVFIVMAVALIGCETAKKNDLQVAQETQRTVMERATAAEPPYQPQSFPARKAINKRPSGTPTP